MGVISRQVLPVCANFACFACPGLRARSRQPVKRYRTLLQHVFPKSQAGKVNDRAINKLADYAAHNPERVPKIVNKLEQRGYSELKAEHYLSVEAVMHAYSRLLVVCRDHMRLFAASAVSMIRAVLEHRKVEIRILACNTFLDFILNQTDGSNMHSVDGLGTKLVAATREAGEGPLQRSLRATALHALSAMVWYMGQFSHLSPCFDEVVTAVLDNYALPADADAEELRRLQQQQQQPRGSGDAHAEQPSRTHHLPGFHRQEAVAKVEEALAKAHRDGKDLALPLNVPHLSKSEMEDPAVWAALCVHVLARVASADATTARRVLDPVLHYLDNGNHWVPLPHCLAAHTLSSMLRSSTHSSAGSGHVMLALILRHLEQRNVSIVRCVTQLAQTLGGATAAAAAGVGGGGGGGGGMPHGAALLLDLTRHLRRCMEQQQQPGVAERQLSELEELQHGLEECLLAVVHLVVRDARPLTDIMAGSLESLPSDPRAARSTMAAMFTVAKISAGLLDRSQALPEALLLQVAEVMTNAHPDTRMAAHKLLALLLAPPDGASLPQHSGQDDADGLGGGGFWHMRSPRKGGLGRGARERRRESGSDTGSDSDSAGVSDGGEVLTPRMGSSSTMGRLRSLKAGLEQSVSAARRRAHHHRGSSKHEGHGGKLVEARVRGADAMLLLDSLWVQAGMRSNGPACYEAMGHTFSLLVHLSEPQRVMGRALQLALSLHKLPSPEEVGNSRSLHTLALSMLLTAAEAYSIPALAAAVTPICQGPLRDPYMRVEEGGKLCALSEAQLSAASLPPYGSAPCEAAAAEAMGSASAGVQQTAAQLVSLLLAAKPELTNQTMPWLEVGDEELIRSPSIAGTTTTSATDDASQPAVPSVADILHSLTNPGQQATAAAGTAALTSGSGPDSWQIALAILEELNDKRDSNISLPAAPVSSERDMENAGNLWSVMRLPSASPLDTMLRAAA
eukprot:jgi/Mesen1/9987/ME000072S09402